MDDRPTGDIRQINGHIAECDVSTVCARANYTSQLNTYDFGEDSVLIRLLLT
jgi:hypothetical protein